MQSLTGALVLFAHGSRDPQWAAPFRAVQDKVAALKPDVAVDLAFLEFMRPSLPEAVDALVASGRQHVTIAPLFLAQGAHLKRDLAKLVADVRERYPQLDVRLLPALGEVDVVVDAMSAWLAQHS